MIKKRETALRNIKEGHSKMNQWSDELLRDRELCLEAVKQDCGALYYVPPDIRDREICLEAVKQNGEMLYYVPEEVLDYDICLEAVKQSSEMLALCQKNFLPLKTSESLSGE